MDARSRPPSVDALLRSAPGRRASDRFGREVVKTAIRDELDAARRRGSASDAEDLIRRAVRTAARASLGMAPVINATGVVLHTNLGRAPLPRPAVRAVARAAASYADLEVDRETGKRGGRTGRAELLLRALTGAEDALVVNNNAAALLLALMGLAARREVLVSRGELIEIGGEFRLPEIMSASTAKLVEVGTTNRTRLSDYELAMGPRTALILAVHPSNYRVTGFAETPDISALAGLAKRRGLPLLHDTGSGLLERSPGMPAEEPAARTSLDAGADLVCFSGDKLLGGPQAGIVLGRRELVTRLRRHPIARAVRVDKMTLAALESILHLHATGRTLEVPVRRVIDASVTELRERARALASSLPGAEPVATQAVAGGGSLPGWAVPSHGVTIASPNAASLAARLRVGRPSVFCRVDGDGVVLDLRTVDPEEDAPLARAVRYALAQDT